MWQNGLQAKPERNTPVAGLVAIGVAPIFELGQHLDGANEKKAACHDKASKQSVQPQGHENGISGDQGGYPGNEADKDA